MTSSFTMLQLTHLTSKASCGGSRNGGETNGGDVRLGGVHPHPLHPVHWDGRRLAWRGFLHHILVGPRAHIYTFDGKTITWKEAVELFAALIPSHRVNRRGGGVGAVQSGVSTQLNSFFFIYIFYCLLRQPLFVVGTQLKSFFLYFCFSKQPLFAVEERYKRTWTYLGTLTPTTSSPGLGGWGRQRSGQRQRNINLDFNCQERNVGTI